MSTFTFWNSCGRNAFMASAAWIVASNNFSSRSAPTRFRHLLRLDGSIGNSCCMYVQPQKNCQYGFSTQRATTDSSLSLKACFKYDEADHQPRVHAWPAQLFGVTSVDGRVELRPVHPLGQYIQRMLGIQQFAQTCAKQFTLRSGYFRLHFFASFRGPKDQNLANFSAMTTAMHPLFVAAKEFFRDDYIEGALNDSSMAGPGNRD